MAEVCAKALGKIVSGLYIVSLKDGDQEAGFLASWVVQAGFDAPSVTIAFNKERSHYIDMFKNSGKAVINVMAKESGKTMSAFFKAPPEGKSIFDDLDTTTSEAGIPVLNDSVAYLEVEYDNQVESGDHVIVLAKVTSGSMLHEDWAPSTHIRPDGFKY